MTDKYETGRLYSGAYNNQQVIFIYAEDTAWGVRDEDGDVVAPSVKFITDVRGPLVVLDPIDSPKAVIGELRDCPEHGECGGGREIDSAHTWIADQIEEQTRPPEPTNIGAIVRAASGDLFIRTNRPDYHWQAVNTGERVSWSVISGGTIIHDGWAGDTDE